MEHTDENINDLEALNNFFTEIENSNVNKKDYRYSIVFKQFERNKKETYRSDLNFINMQQKFGKIVRNEAIAIIFLFSERRYYWQWCKVFDNSKEEGPDRVVLWYQASKGFNKNTLVKGSEIHAITTTIKEYRQKKKSARTLNASNGEKPKERDVNKALQHLTSSFSLK